MIRFCDREIVACSMEEIQGMSRGELISFFIREGTTLMILVFDEEGLLIGSIAYHDVLKYMELEEYLNPTRFCISDTFWGEAREYFAQNKRTIIPVCNKEQQVLGFCYKDWDKEYWHIERVLEGLVQNSDNALFIQEIWPFVEQVCIMDCNEWAYQVYQLCLKKKIPVCLIGERWEWFGYTTCEGIYDYPDYAKFYIYAEGQRITRGRDIEFSCHTENLGQNFLFILEIFYKNIMYIRKNFLTYFKKNGVEVCNIILPNDTEVTYKTKIELEAKRFDIHLVRGINEYSCLTDLQKKYIEIFQDKETYTKSLEIEGNKNDAKKQINGRKELYHVSEQLQNKRIYVIGPCITTERRVKTENNLISMIQKRVEGYGYSVVACTIPNNTLDWCILEELSIRRSDIILFVHATYTYDEDTKGKFTCLETLELFNDEERDTWYPDEPIHMNAKGMKCLADYIYTNYLEEALQKKLQLNEEEALTYLQKGKLFADEHVELVDTYIQSVKSEQIQAGSTVGSIVMNCNPFTLGHQYLTETAAKNVDYLYIFVVEENRSDYDFAERMKMVQDGTSHLSNVIVVPSGKLIASYNTLPIYFEKSVKQEAKMDASLDLEIFGQWIAPKLDITYRFVGEEPIDKVTKQYNEQMQILLSQYGIKVIEIPRKELEGEVVSASRVRKLIADGKEEEAKKLVPTSTWDVLKQK